MRLDGIPGVADGEARGGIAELTAEHLVLVHLGLADGQARRRALLAVVAEGRADEIADGLISIRERRDDHRVLAARLGEEREVRSPREEPARRLDRAGEDDGVHARVGDEPAAHVAVGTRQEGERLAWNAGVPEGLGEMPADQHGLGRGLEDDAIARGERGEHAARGDGQREVPGRRHDHDAERLHPALAQIVHLVERARVVAREVDRLRDLGVGLGHGLGAVDDHRADQVTAPPGEHVRPPGRARRGAPRAAGPPRRAAPRAWRRGRG